MALASVARGRRRLRTNIDYRRRTEAGIGGRLEADCLMEIPVGTVGR